MAKLKVRFESGDPKFNPQAQAMYELAGHSCYFVLLADATSSLDLGYIHRLDISSISFG
jgi:hypothetical protein